MKKRFAILLAAFNGERFIADQLGSLERQTEPNIDIWLRDHGSTDTTLQLSREAKSDWRKGAFHILTNEGAMKGAKPSIGGACENFAALVHAVDTAADYYAFSDQDDIWDPDKLAAAREWLDRQDDNIPALHCSRTRILDEQGEQQSLSAFFQRPPSFRNAIVQSIAGGNTMVMNRAAMVELKNAFDEAVVVHDWWTYIVVTGLGGNVHYSEEAKTGYRQHGDNLIGENMSIQAKTKRLNMLLSGVYSNWNETNRNALRKIETRLTPDALSVLEDFDYLRENGGFSGLSRLWRSGIYRQTTLGQLSLYAACFLKKT